MKKDNFFFSLGLGWVKGGKTHLWALYKWPGWGLKTMLNNGKEQKGVWGTFIEPNEWFKQ